MPPSRVSRPTFLTIPAEIRLQIYAHVFRNVIIRVHSEDLVMGMFECMAREDYMPSIHMALTMVNKRIRKESIPILAREAFFEMVNCWCTRKSHFRVPPMIDEPRNLIIHSLLFCVGQLTELLRPRVYSPRKKPTTVIVVRNTFYELPYQFRLVYEGDGCVKMHWDYMDPYMLVLMGLFNEIEIVTERLTPGVKIYDSINMTGWTAVALKKILAE